MINDEQQLDLRIRRTHKLLWKSLFELMTISKMKYSSITVNQICDHAMVHRTTFYKHFENKDALLAVGFTKVHEEILKVPLIDRLSKPFQIMEQYVKDEEIGQIFDSQSFDEHFINRVHDLARELRKQETEELTRLCKNNSIPIGLIVEFYTSVVPALGTWWFQNGRAIPTVEMDRYLNQLINQDVFHLKKNE